MYFIKNHINDIGWIIIVVYNLYQYLKQNYLSLIQIFLGVSRFRFWVNNLAHQFVPYPDRTTYCTRLEPTTLKQVDPIGLSLDFSTTVMLGHSNINWGINVWEGFFSATMTTTFELWTLQITLFSTKNRFLRDVTVV